MSESKQDVVIRYGALLVGVSMILLATFRSALSDAVAGLLVVLGAFIVVLGLFFERIESIGFKWAQSEFHAELSKVVGRKVTRELDKTGVTGLVETYAFVHETLSADADRASKIKLQDALVAKVADTSFAVKPDRKAVKKLAEGSAAERALALGFLYGDESLQTLDALAPAISQPLSGNEQYHGLVLADKAWPRLSPNDRTKLAAIVRTRPYAGEDPDRDGIADAILTKAKGGTS